MRDAVVHYERVRDVLVARQRPGGTVKPSNSDVGRLYTPPLPKRGSSLATATSHHYTPSQPQDLPMKAPRGRSALRRGLFDAWRGPLQRPCNAPSVGSEAIRSREKGGQVGEQVPNVFATEVRAPFRAPPR